MPFMSVYIYIQGICTPCLCTLLINYIKVRALKMITKNNTLDILDTLINKHDTNLLWTYMFCCVNYPIVQLDQKRWILLTCLDTQCVLPHTGHDDTYIHSNVAVLSEISLRSPWILLIFIIPNKKCSIKISKKRIYFILKKNFTVA